MSEQTHKAGDLSISDSGERQEFKTGARRDTSTGKGFYVYFPANAFLGLVSISPEQRDPLDGALNSFFGFLRDSSDPSQLLTAALYALRAAQPECGFEAGCKGFLGLPYNAVHQLAQLFEAGARKYGDASSGPYRQNWQNGMPVSRYLDSGIRHMFKHLAGDKADPHLICAAWNALCAYETLHMIRVGKLPAELNDMPADVSPYASDARKELAASLKELTSGCRMVTRKDPKGEEWTYIRDNHPENPFEEYVLRGSKVNFTWHTGELKWQASVFTGTSYAFALGATKPEAFRLLAKELGIDIENVPTKIVNPWEE